MLCNTPFNQVHLYLIFHKLLMSQFYFRSLDMTKLPLQRALLSNLKTRTKISRALKYNLCILLVILIFCRRQSITASNCASRRDKMSELVLFSLISPSKSGKWERTLSGQVSGYSKDFSFFLGFLISLSFFLKQH